MIAKQNGKLNHGLSRTMSAHGRTERATRRDMCGF
jgi:hypothetical protein